MKRPRRLAVIPAFYGTFALAGGIGIVGLGGLGSLGIERTEAPIEVSRATSATDRAELDAPRATALGEHEVSVADIASGSAALSDPAPMPQPVTPPALFAAVTPKKNLRSGDRIWTRIHRTLRRLTAKNMPTNATRRRRDSLD